MRTAFTTSRKQTYKGTEVRTFGVYNHSEVPLATYAFSKLEDVSREVEQEAPFVPPVFTFTSGKQQFPHSCD